MNKLMWNAHHYTVNFSDEIHSIHIHGELNDKTVAFIFCPYRFAFVYSLVSRR